MKIINTATLAQPINAEMLATLKNVRAWMVDYVDPTTGGYVAEMREIETTIAKAEEMSAQQDIAS